MRFTMEGNKAVDDPRLPKEGEIVVKLEKSHRRKKEGLGDRLVVMRALLIRLYEHERQNLDENDFCKYIEAELDNCLYFYEYDLERCIDVVRLAGKDNWADKFPIFCKKCDYRPVFCICKGNDLALSEKETAAYAKLWK